MALEEASYSSRDEKRSRTESTFESTECLGISLAEVEIVKTMLLSQLPCA